MRILVLLALSMITACAQERSRNWNISVAFYAGAQVVDAASSRGWVEANPVLGRGQFGGRQAGIKAGIGGGMLLTEWMILRRHPETRRFWTWANYAAGAVTVSVAARNWSQ
jgi:hypothetical protein